GIRDFHVTGVQTCALPILDYVQADAERLPFAAGTFHCVAIGFGLRNVTDKEAALASMFRVLKPGGRLLVLEFSQPHLGPLNAVRSEERRVGKEWRAWGWDA